MGTNGPVYLKDIWPTNKEIADLVEATVTRAAFQKKYADVFKGDAKWQAVETTDRETYDWPRALDLHPEPALFPRHGQNAGRDQRHRRRPRPGPSGRHDHHRPHLARRFVQSHNPGGQIPDRTAGSGVRVQLLRLAARQPRGDDARHLRQHPHQERDAGRGRRRLYPRPGRRRRPRSTTPRWPIRRLARPW